MLSGVAGLPRLQISQAPRSRGCPAEGKHNCGRPRGHQQLRVVRLLPHHLLHILRNGILSALIRTLSVQRL